MATYHFCSEEREIVLTIVADEDHAAWNRLVEILQEVDTKYGLTLIPHMGWNVRRED